MMENVWYIEDVYRQWQQDPTGVGEGWAGYFRDMLAAEAGLAPALSPQGAPSASGPGDMAYRQSRVDSLLWAYRDIGYLYARLNPLGGNYGPVRDYIERGDEITYEKLTLEEFDIPPEDIDTVFSAGRVMKPSPAPLGDILEAFRQTYCGSIGVEFLHIQDKRIRHWLIEKMESTRNRPTLSAGQKRIILEDLLRTEALEQAIQRFFVGQKRFSIEGSEAIIPGLHFLVDNAQRYGIEEFVLGTTHRGRLAMLNTILHMTPEDIFSTFEENFKPGMYGGGGDVKYHIGYTTEHVLDEGGTVHIDLCANASHLESIDPIVEGKARALQDQKGDRDRKRILPIVLHGDAAFSGQGMVSEILNLSRLEGFTTGGTIHIVINNQIGFTTTSRSGRSSFFPTDVAKRLGVPIFHVNGDDPEALVYVADLALQFRQKFGVDCIVDVFCYRRHGHNEADEPSFTHPRMYKIIRNHPSVSGIYGEHCAQLGIASQPEQAAITQKYADGFKEALDHARAEPSGQITDSQGPPWAKIEHDYSHERVETGVEESTLRRIALHLTEAPEGFHLHPLLGRILERKRAGVREDSLVDWSMAEALAFGSLLREGVPVRLSGEDCARGTFSQRHMTWWDTESERPKPYTPLGTLAEGQAPLSLFDSPLSEYSILGFEYGYSLVNPQGLVIWEAQFGDFANGAQVIIDNYLVCAESKWHRSSGLVLLLPHGIEGQGPDHSSAHLERFLQLAAEDNIQVCNLTTPAQYFHVLRRQVKAGYRKPLVIMSPKSLLRHAKAVSGLGELAKGCFQEVLDDVLDPEPVEKIMLCCGKVYYDLLAQREAVGVTNAALIRLELLYPFPEEALEECLARYANVRKITWVQEEPRNLGAWSFMHQRFRERFPQIELEYLGRDESASSAAGSFKQYQQEQKELMEAAFETAKIKG